MKALRVVSQFLILLALAVPAWSAGEPGIDLEATGRGNKQGRGGVPAVEVRLAALEHALADANRTIARLQRQLDIETGARQAADRAIRTELGDRLAYVENTLTCVTYDGVGRSVLFVGCNVHVRDGSGLTAGTTGLGNLIVGYNADTSGMLSRYGSHNVIVGDGQAYTTSATLLTRSVASNQYLSVNVGDHLTVATAGDLRAQAGTAMRLSSTEEIALTSGKAEQRLEKGGDITIDGRDVDVTASGTLSVKASRTIQN